MRKATIELEGDELIIDGMRVTASAIPQALYELAHPDPRKWYNFERTGNTLLIHVEIREPERPTADYPIPPEVKNGNYVTERSPSPSGEGSEAANPLHEHRPNGQ
jgi:hypothetical protein